MFREMLRSKLSYPVITQAELWYEGSITLDADLMRAADIREGEKVDVLNVNNGERFHTYAIAGTPGSGVVCLNGPAARKGIVGDRIVVLTYGLYSDEDLSGYKSVVVKVDEKNRVTDTVVR
jgi:aspartate 1-decarboxylase